LEKKKKKKNWVFFVGGAEFSCLKARSASGVFFLFESREKKRKGKPKKTD
jgi:hypothetical protein